MNTMPATTASPAAAVAEQYNFVEETCFTRDDRFKEERPPAMFRVFSVGRHLGAKFDVTIRADFGVFYGDDDFLVECLEVAAPHVAWGRDYVFHRWPDYSRIQCLHPDTGKLVAQLQLRAYQGKKVRLEAVEAGEYGANVQTLAQLRAQRAAKAVAGE